jgi:N-acetylglucosaminyl-diphospho-decaprenol L-rhamnosyltransferase
MSVEPIRADHMRPVTLSIVIVSWNCSPLLRQCLESVLANETSFTFEILVVDNDSADDTAAMIRDSFPQVRFHVSGSNLGFAKANNLGFRITDGRYVLLLNPDTLLPDDTILERLVSFLERRQNVAAAGCRLVFPDHTHQVGDAGYRPTPAALICFSFGLSRMFPRRFHGLFLSDHAASGQECVEVDWICGACFLVRRAVIDAVGGLDESFPMYGEDTEWGCRIRSAGYVIAHLPQISVVHVQSGTQFNDGARVVSTRWLDGLARLYRMLNGGRSFLYFRIVMATGFLLRAAVYYVAYTVTRRTPQRWKARAMALYGRHAWTLSESETTP